VIRNIRRGIYWSGIRIVAVSFLEA